MCLFLTEPKQVSLFIVQSEGNLDDWPLGVKTERIISDQPIDRKLTERKNGFGRIVGGYGHGYG
jgi:hypothetical protein